MDFKFIFPSEFIETFVILKKLDYNEGKNFCCKNLSLTKIDTCPLRRILIEKFNYNYFAFGQWYLKTTKLPCSKREHLSFIYKNRIQKIPELSEFVSGKERFIKSFKDKIILNKKGSFFIFFNILDFYNHAFNWPYKNDYIISISPKTNREFNWNALRHEIFHIILKQNSKFKIKDPLLKKIAPKGYENEEDRVILDEITILALCLLFKETGKTEKLLKFYDSIGYEIVRYAYRIIQKSSSPIVLNSKFQKNLYHKLKKMAQKNRNFFKKIKAFNPKI